MWHLDAVCADTSSQGISVHSKKDINTKTHEALLALTTILGDKPYLVGSSPSEPDCTLFAWTDQVIYSGMTAPELADILRQYPSLLQHYKCIRLAFWADAQRPFPDGPLESALQAKKTR